MRLIRRIFFILIVLNSLHTAAWAKGDPNIGKSLSATCVACHNADGNSTVGMWPKIAGQHEAYLLKQLLEFKKGEAGNRYVPEMAQMMAPFEESQLPHLAAYFASQKMTPSEADPSNVALGEKIYRGGLIEKGVAACTACHGPQGGGNGAANFPRLNGQHAAYTLAQLKHFRSGTRKNDENAIMRMIAAKLTDEEMQAVSEYIAGLH